MIGSGKIVVITGPMFAGKTTKLMQEIARVRKTGKKVAIFKSSFDKRYSRSNIVSHDGKGMAAMLLPKGRRCIRTMKEASQKYDIIAIDEGHFWDNTDGFAEAVAAIASVRKEVYVSMLDRNWEGKMFKISRDLQYIADRVYVLKATCKKCGSRNAQFSQRIAPVSKGATFRETAGGPEAYEPRCVECFVGSVF